MAATRRTPALSPLSCILPLLLATSAISVPLVPEFAQANLPIDPWIELEASVLDITLEERHRWRQPSWMISSPELKKRQDLFANSNSASSSPTSASSSDAPVSTDSSSSSSSSTATGSASATITKSPSSNSTTTASSTSTSSEAGLLLASTATGAAATPTPFDQSLGTNFTAASCPTFFQGLIKDPTLISCIPVSLLLLNSNGFFTAEGSKSTLNPLLDKSCAVDFGKCNAVMQSYAYQIRQTANCGADYQLNNPLVTQAFDGFVAYEPVWRATCLRSNTTQTSSTADSPSNAGTNTTSGSQTYKGNNYCFADAVTNRSATVDSYPYYLPLGVSLSGRPSCTSCLKQTMAIFNGFAGNATIPLSDTYKAAAQQINLGCGPGFADTNVQTVASSAVAVGGSLSVSAAVAVLVGMVVLL